MQLIFSGCDCLIVAEVAQARRSTLMLSFEYGEMSYESLEEVITLSGYDFIGKYSRATTASLLSVYYTLEWYNNTGGVREGSEA